MSEDEEEPRRVEQEAMDNNDLRNRLNISIGRQAPTSAAAPAPEAAAADLLASVLVGSHDRLRPAVAPAHQDQGFASLPASPAHNLRLTDAAPSSGLLPQAPKPTNDGSEGLEAAAAALGTLQRSASLTRLDTQIAQEALRKIQVAELLSGSAQQFSAHAQQFSAQAREQQQGATNDLITSLLNQQREQLQAQAILNMANARPPLFQNLLGPNQGAAASAFPLAGFGGTAPPLPHAFPSQAAASPADLLAAFAEGRLASGPVLGPANLFSVRKAGFEQDNIQEQKADPFIQLAAPGHAKKPRSETFPEKLYRVLLEAERHGKDHIISFAPSGKAFRIHRPEAFMEEIAPHYFKYKNMGSLKRQLHFYRFAKVAVGPEEGCYFHPDFQRGRPDLLSQVKRLAR